jgi:hypothetical protein
MTMKVKFKLFSICLFLISHSLNGVPQDERPKIINYLNKEIILKDRWAGQSITLIKEQNKYYILRKIFGSGVPVAGTFKYEIEFNSDYQITFPKSNIHDSGDSNDYKGEVFLLCSDETGLNLYLNGLQVIILKMSQVK